ncbi:S-layer homology domain-containing protein [Leucobacter sp. HY1910]
MKLNLARKAATLLTASAVAATMLIAAAPAAHAAPEQLPGTTKRFPDVPQGHKFYTPITWMYNTGLTTGTKIGGRDYYQPGSALTREAMAAFLYRLSGDNYTAPKKSPFVDMKPGDKFYREISWMKAKGLSTGTKTARGVVYQPKAALTREAMAAFMYRTNGKPAAGISAAFTDVPRAHKFNREIAWMQKSGITTGYADGTFKPRSTVTREAMAAFIHRDAGSPGYVETGTATISGDAVEGKTLTAQASGWGTSGVQLSYEWLIDGKPVTDSSTQKLTIPEGKSGSKVAVRVTGTVANTFRTVTSAAMTIKAVPVEEVHIYGTVSVKQSGRTVTAIANDWGPTGVKLAYQWLDWGQPISGATKANYTVPSDQSMNLSVKVTGTLPGAKTRVANSHYQPQNGGGIQIDAVPTPDLSLEQFREVYAEEVIRLVNELRADPQYIDDWRKTVSGGVPIKPEPYILDRRLKPMGDFQTDFWVSKGLQWALNNSSDTVHGASGWYDQYPQPHPDGSPATAFMTQYENAASSGGWDALSQEAALDFAAFVVAGWLESPGHRKALFSQVLDAGSAHVWASVGWSASESSMFGNIYPSYDYRLYL